MKLLSCRSIPGWERRLCVFQGLGQLEHIIAEHVEVGLGARQASWKRGQHGDMGSGFPCQELRDFLIELHLGNDNPNVVALDSFDERMQVSCRRFSSGLGKDRARNTQVVALSEIGPGRVMDDDRAIRQLFQ